MKKDKTNENILNVPNALTFVRIVVTFLVVYFIFSGGSPVFIVSLFVFGMITDFLDGQIARRFKQTTEFGRKFDMVADRFLMIGVVSAYIINFIFLGILDRTHLAQIFMVLSREIISAPVSFIAFTSRKPIPKARFIGKLTTFLQGVTLPAVILSVYYPVFSFSFYLSALTFVIGSVSGFRYIKDVIDSECK